MIAINLSKMCLVFGDAELRPGPVVGDIMHGEFVQQIFIEQGSGNAEVRDSSTLHYSTISSSPENGAN